MEKSGYIVEIGNKIEDSQIRNSKIGGNPNFRKGFDYPEGKENPLEFLLQIDLSEIPNHSNFLPEKGILYFFVDNDFGFYGESKVIYETDTVDLTNTKSPYKNEIEIYDEHELKLKSVKSIENWDENPILLLQNHKYISGDLGELYLNMNGFEIIKNAVHFGKNDYLEYFGRICGPTKDYLEILKPENIFPSKQKPEIQKEWKNQLVRFAKEEEFHKKNIENMICLLSLKSNSIMTWWDMGHIEFYIMKDDLLNLNFDKVRFTFTSG